MILVSFNNLSALDILCSDLQLFDAEKRIAAFILEHQDEAAGMTLSALAQASGSSEATVSRFCKHLGFESYRAFQISLARDVHERPQPQLASHTVSAGNIEQSLQNILAVKLAEVSGTVHNIDPSVLRAVLDVLCNADIIQIAATGNTIPVAMDAAFKFNQLGLRATTTEISEKATAFALTLTEHDALVIFSNSGRSKRLQALALAAKDRGVSIILVTGSRNSPLAKIADHALYTVNREKLLETAEYPLSRLSATLVVELLYHFLLASIPEASTKLTHHHAIIMADKEDA